MNLWELAAVHQNSELRNFLSTNIDLLYASLSRLLETPATRWERMLDGTLRGYSVDIGYEGKVGFLAEIAAEYSSAQLATMATQLARKLVHDWERQAVNFGPVLRLLDAIGGNHWYLDHGGREVYRTLLEGVLGALNYAFAADWLKLLGFPERAIEWNDTDEKQLKEALYHYEQKGVSDERNNCSTIDEMTELRDSLTELSTKFDLDLEYEINRLDEDIAEREEESFENNEGSGFSQDLKLVQCDIVTDDQIRDMFRTLGEGG